MINERSATNEAQAKAKAQIAKAQAKAASESSSESQQEATGFKKQKEAAKVQHKFNTMKMKMEDKMQMCKTMLDDETCENFGLKMQDCLANIGIPVVCFNEVEELFREKMMAKMKAGVDAFNHVKTEKTADDAWADNAEAADAKAAALEAAEAWAADQKNNESDALAIKKGRGKHNLQDTAAKIADGTSLCPNGKKCDETLLV
jgi:hypothetical protein